MSFECSGQHGDPQLLDLSLYLTFAHCTDGEVDDEEYAVIRTKVGEWMSSDDDDDLKAAMVHTIEW
jgi:hypothetical protein